MINRDVEFSITQAHNELWNRFIKNDGAMLDYTSLKGEAVIPTFEECNRHMPNAMGWSTPIEDGPFYNGFYLDALCNKYLLLGDEKTKKEANIMANALLSFAVNDGVDGFITRGFSSDGKAYYGASSDDQVFPWFYGLWRYIESDIPTTNERIHIIKVMENVGKALEKFDFKVPCWVEDFGFRGSFKRSRVEDITRLLFILRALNKCTKNEHWISLYNKHLNTDDYYYYLSNLEVCAKGSDYEPYIDKMVFFPFKKEVFKSEAFCYDKIHIDPVLPFFTTAMVQVALRGLIDMEENEEISAYYKLGLKKSAEIAATHIKRYKEFDNQNSLDFCWDWRFLNEYWEEQNNIKDTHRIANSQLIEWYKKSPRSPYENNYVREPLFALWIATLSGDNSILSHYEEDIKGILTHYDWSKLFTSTFFVAECAFYQLSVELSKKQ